MELFRLKQERQISEPYLLSCHGKPRNAEWFLQCVKYLIFLAIKKEAIPETLHGNPRL